jgi:hypothetical protein
MGIWGSIFGKSNSELLQLRMSCFNIGTITATPNAVALCEALGVTSMDFVKRHASGDFGMIDYAQREINNKAMNNPRYDAVSAYAIGSYIIYVVTKQGISTTVMHSTDYHFYSIGRG